MFLFQAILLLVLWLWEKKFGPTPMLGKQPTKSEAHKIRPELIESSEVFYRSNEGIDERTPLLSRPSPVHKVRITDSVPIESVDVSKC